MTYKGRELKGHFVTNFAKISSLLVCYNQDWPSIGGGNKTDYYSHLDGKLTGTQQNHCQEQELQPVKQEKEHG